MKSSRLLALASLLMLWVSASVAQNSNAIIFTENGEWFTAIAYGRTYDIGNYYKVNDAFTFESSIDELNGYINAYRR